MKTLRFLLEKEFRQIFRNPAILRMIFIMPVIQLIVMPLAADYEIKNINLGVVDNDQSAYSQSLTRQIAASGYFKLQQQTPSYKQALQGLELDKTDIVLQIPNGFEKQLIRENEAGLLLTINAVNGVKANLGGAYLRNIIQAYNQQIRLKWIQMPAIPPIPIVGITVSNWFNPLMNYRVFMVPGILVILLTMVGSFLTALNIVKEKETGTIEQVNVTPIRKHHFILGKLIPFWVLGMVVLTLGLGVVRLIYGISPAGGLLPIYCFAAVYLLAILGLGLLISTYAQTQQQAMLISFFIMMVLILLGGLYTSIDSMPYWAQVVTWFNPAAYFIEIMRMVVLKGSGIPDIAPQIGIMLVFALVLNTWAIVNYRKRS